MINDVLFSHNRAKYGRAYVEEWRRETLRYVVWHPDRVERMDQFGFEDEKDVMEIDGKLPILGERMDVLEMNKDGMIVRYYRTIFFLSCPW